MYIKTNKKTLSIDITGILRGLDIQQIKQIFVTITHSRTNNGPGVFYSTVVES